MDSNIRRAGVVQGGPRIVVIGGGTGLSVILRGLKKITSNISAVVTMTDDGGGSGVIRDELGMLPPGDVRNCIHALADDEDIMEKLLQYRFNDGRLKGQNMGNLLIAAMADIYEDFEVAVNKLQHILRIKGRVIPVTTEDVTLCAELKDGSIIRGESQIPEMVRRLDSPISRIFLEPESAVALPAAVRAIRSADLIIMGPGSLYSSIVPNFLVKGIAEAIRDASGIKMLVCNVMTQPGETDDFSVSAFAGVAERYLGAGVIECMLVNNHICTSEQIAPYLAEGTRQMLATKEDRRKIQEMGIMLVESNLIRADGGYIRHDADRLTQIAYSMLR